MAGLSETDHVRISTEAGEQFVDQYYNALNGARSTLASYYVPTNTSGTGRTLPLISLNGEHVTNGSTLQEVFEHEMPWTYFEPQSVNAHVLNPAIVATPGMSKRDAERNVSIVVQVSGSVRLEERQTGPLQAFSDNLVLVPNKEEAGAKGTGKQDHGMRWLIQTQSFRFVT